MYSSAVHCRWSPPHVLICYLALPIAPPKSRKVVRGLSPRLRGGRCGSKTARANCRLHKGPFPQRIEPARSIAQIIHEPRPPIASENPSSRTPPTASHSTCSTARFGVFGRLGCFNCPPSQFCTAARQAPSSLRQDKLRESSLKPLLRVVFL